MIFEDFLKSHIDSTSFCVVGNAPIEINKNKGKEIDQYRHVLRFNDYSLNFSKDYGSKVNVWVRAKGVYTHENKDYYNHELIILRALDDKNLNHRQVWEKRDQSYVVMPVHYENDLSKELKAIPSTGLLLLYILKENGYKFDRNLYGFSFDNKRYFKSKQSASKHNWNSEKIFFKNKILEK